MEGPLHSSFLGRTKNPSVDPCAPSYLASNTPTPKLPRKDLFERYVNQRWDPLLRPARPAGSVPIISNSSPELRRQRVLTASTRSSSTVLAIPAGPRRALRAIAALGSSPRPGFISRTKETVGPLRLL